MKLKITATILSAGLLAAGCTTTGNIERNAAGGAAAGALIGAIIGNNTGEGDADEGAAIGALIGGAAGAARGYEQDRRQGVVGGSGYRQNDSRYSENDRNRPRSGPNGERLYWDQRAGRYFYVDQYGDSYWANGQRRR